MGEKTPKEALSADDMVKAILGGLAAERKEDVEPADGQKFDVAGDKVVHDVFDLDDKALTVDPPHGGGPTDDAA